MKLLRSRHPGVLIGSALASLAGASACIDRPDPVSLEASPPPRQTLTCSIDISRVQSGGVVRDGIPALTNPPLVGKDDPSLDYLFPQTRVIGVMLGDEPVAIPHPILWWHEIVNLDRNGLEVTITHCPLTGSSLGFDRAGLGSVEFGVSGLLFDNNLIMFDRNGDDSLWPQMLSAARCGSRDGTPLPQIPVVDMSWDGWRSLHPNTRVISGNLAFDRDYNRYPYGGYRDERVPEFLFPMPILDTRLPQKEVVIGVPTYDGPGLAFSTAALERVGRFAAVERTFEGEPIVLFWDTERQGGMAYRPVVDGDTLTFTATESGIFDDGTGSNWNVLGRAVEGPLAGDILEPVAETYVAFWGAWINFHRGSALWEG